MTPSTTTPLDLELLEIEANLDTEDFLLDDLLELSGTEDSEFLEEIDDEDLNFAFGCDTF
tara:strand:- start:1068 stop:1247 length:180 start_codon:yes stop_codon:yes gene_type:complete